MANANVQITGLVELNVLLQGIPTEFPTIFQQVTGNRAQQMVSEMTSIVPVRTGYLKSTIGSSSTTLAMEVYVDAPYAGFVNFGTRFQRAQPYFSGPVERHIQPMIDELNQGIASYIASNVT